MMTEPLQIFAETVQASSLFQDRERALRLRGVLTIMSLRDENVTYEATPVQERDEAAQPSLH